MFSVFAAKRNESQLYFLWYKSWQ